MDLLEWVQGTNTLLNAHQRVVTLEEVLNNPMEKRTHFVAVHLLFPSHPVVAQYNPAPNGHGGGDGVCVWP